MTSKILNMVFKATDKATPTLKQIQSGTGGLDDFGTALGGLVNPATLALSAITALAAASADAVRDWRAAGVEVDNLKKSLGLTAEEASFLQHNMDKFGITNDTMVAVFRTMNRTGLEPTVQNLKAVLVEYDNITDGAEKMLYAQKMFGEQGLKQVIPWWESLTEAQRENFGVQEDGIKWTDEQLENAREMEIALADLNIAWDTLRLNMVEKYAPDIIMALEAINEALENAELIWVVINALTGNMTPALEMYMDTALESAKATYGLGDAMDDAARAAEASGARWQAMADHFLGIEQAAWDASAAIAELAKTTSKQQVMDIAMEYGLGSEEFQTAYAGYLHNTAVRDQLSGLLFPTEDKPTRTTGARRAENKQLARDIAEELGEVFANENIKDAQMLDDIRRMLRGLPMSIRDATARTEI